MGRRWDGMSWREGAATVHEVTISHRGASYEIGRGQDFYGIWPAGASQWQPQPLEWWPVTPQGWQAAWSRFAQIEGSGAAGSDPASSSATINSGATMVTGRRPAPADRASIRTVVPAVLIAIGVTCGIVGLFSGYLGGASLAAEPAEVVPHAIYLAVWSASAVLIVLGGSRVRIGALLGLGTSIITFGLFFADVGAVIAGGTHLAGLGLGLSLLGWLVCSGGSAVAFGLRQPGAQERPQGHDRRLTLVLAGVAAVGAAVAFAPSWDSYTLTTLAGATQYLTAGDAFANPAPVIAGNVAVMVALVAVAFAAAAWRPVREGAAILAGAVIPLVAQAISAIVEIGQPISPLQFGITPAQAAQAGLTISPGLTAAFWIYCAFVVALLLTCARMITTPPPIPLPPAPPRRAELHSAGMDAAAPPAAGALS
jgi:hypothetical protein